MKVLVYLFIWLSYNIIWAQSINEDVLNAYHSISSNNIHSYVLEMTNEKYKGRLCGTKEYMQITEWIANKFSEWKLVSHKKDNDYFQKFKYTYCDIKDEGEVTLYLKDKTYRLKPKDDYYLGSNSANGQIKSELVFVGYGITNPEENYDDYQGVDVKNKIVLILAGNPYKGEDPEKQKIWGRYNYPYYKYENAYKKGAKGVLLVRKIAMPKTPMYKDFYFATISDEIVELIFKSENLNLEDVKKEISEKMQPKSFVFKAKAKIKSKSTCFLEGESANIIAYIEGNDSILKNEVFLVGAHFDGQGSVGFTFPSAYDNASGSAIVMELARALSKVQGKMKRSVVIVLFACEECGLIGSRFFCDNSFVPLENIKLMLNLDMVGNGSGLALWGGKSYPELSSVFEQINEKYIHRKLSLSENPEKVVNLATDGMLFLSKGVPTVHIGTTEAEFPVYYHSHLDTPDLISYETAEDVARWLFLSIFEIANK